MRRSLLNTDQSNGCNKNATSNVIVKKIMKFSLISVLGLAILAPFTNYGGRPTTSISGNGKDSTQNTKTIYNLYVENSGSLKGYFNGNSTAKVIIKEYYDRISQDIEEGDTITLNYINESIKPIKQSISVFLSDIQKNCNAQYSKIDDILSKAISAIDKENVQILISDYCFTSNSGDFRTAQSGITSIFSKKIKSDSDFSVLIKKYDCDFKGKYYPGGVQHNGQRPIYIWVMGNNSTLKDVLDLDIKEDCKTICLQKKQTIEADIKAKKARMVNRSDNSINVKEWDAERNGSKYKLNFELDLSKLLIDGELASDIMNYEISNNYTIEGIKDVGGGKYSFSISTPKPSPRILEIKYSQEIPSWVSSSNFEGNGIPKSTQTLGIKALICGAYDAFNPKGNSIVFSSSITIK